MTEEIKRLVVGMLEVNCYLVALPHNKRLYIIDPGDEADRIIAAADEFPDREKVILLTHAHIDHIKAVGRVAEKFRAPVMLHPDDRGLYHSPNNQLPPFISAATDLPATVSDIADADFTLLHTPGHTRGGVCYYFSQLPALFSGDTLFAQTVGRTDLPGGDHLQLINSIREKLLILPDELPIYPGHGDPTTIGQEKRYNQYLRG